jgi:uncharacterized protein
MNDDSPITRLEIAQMDATPLGDVQAPILKQERIVSIDVLRGFALLGILVMNIQSFSMIGVAYFNPFAWGSMEGANEAVWRYSHIFADQKFMTIFSMLFGAGVLIFSQRAEAKTGKSAGLHYRRMGWLILFGMLHGYLLWYGDILYAYGMCGLLVYLFRRRSPRWLIPLGVIALCIPSGLNVLSGWSMQFWPEENVTEFMQGIWTPTEAMVADELAAMRGSWVDQMGHRVIGTFSMQTMIFVFFIAGRVVGNMLLGMALYKLGILAAKRTAGFYLGMLGLGFSIGLLLIKLGMNENSAHLWDGAFAFFYGVQFNYWGSIFMAMAYIALIMLLCKLPFMTWLNFLLAAVGRTAFTNYIGHTVICTSLFYGHGLGWYGTLERTEQMKVVLCVWALQLLISPLWLACFRFGPLEWVWRCLTYWRWQPITRTRTVAA